MGENSNKEKWLSVKNILIILGLSLAASLAYNFGKSIFGDSMNITKTIETFVFLIIVQFLGQFFTHHKNNK